MAPDIEYKGWTLKPVKEDDAYIVEINWPGKPHIFFSTAIAANGVISTLRFQVEDEAVVEAKRIVDSGYLSYQKA